MYAVITIVVLIIVGLLRPQAARRGRGLAQRRPLHLAGQPGRARRPHPGLLDGAVAGARGEVPVARAEVLYYTMLYYTILYYTILY